MSWLLWLIDEALDHSRYAPVYSKTIWINGYWVNFANLPTKCFVISYAKAFITTWQIIISMASICLKGVIQDLFILLHPIHTPMSCNFVMYSCCWFGLVPGGSRAGHVSTVLLFWSWGMWFSLDGSLPQCKCRHSRHHIHGTICNKAYTRILDCTMSLTEPALFMYVTVTTLVAWLRGLGMTRDGCFSAR